MPRAVFVWSACAVCLGLSLGLVPAQEKGKVVMPFNGTDLKGWKTKGDPRRLLPYRGAVNVEDLGPHGAARDDSMGQRCAVERNGTGCGEARHRPQRRPRHGIGRHQHQWHPEQHGSHRARDAGVLADRDDNSRAEPSDDPDSSRHRTQQTEGGPHVGQRQPASDPAPRQEADGEPGVANQLRFLPTTRTDEMDGARIVAAFDQGAG